MALLFRSGTLFAHNICFPLTKDIVLCVFVYVFYFCLSTHEEQRTHNEIPKMKMYEIDIYFCDCEYEFVWQKICLHFHCNEHSPCLLCTANWMAIGVRRGVTVRMAQQAMPEFITLHVRQNRAHFVVDFLSVHSRLLARNFGDSFQYAFNIRLSICCCCRCCRLGVRSLANIYRRTVLTEPQRYGMELFGRTYKAPEMSSFGFRHIYHCVVVVWRVCTDNNGLHLRPGDPFPHHRFTMSHSCIVQQ